MKMLNGLFSGANSNTAPSASPATSAPAPAPAQSIQAQVPSQVPAGAGRDNGVLLAQAQQARQAPQAAQAPEAQIKSLFANLDSMRALNLLMELMTPFMGMLGMGPAPAAEKPAQTSAPQAQLPSQTQSPMDLTELDQLMAQTGAQATAKVTSNEGFEAMLEDLAKQTSLNSTPTAQASSQQQPQVSLASQNANKPALTQAPTLAA